jgi:hypothetical protein
MAFAPYIPLRASRSNLGALAIIMNFSTLVYNIPCEQQLLIELAFVIAYHNSH